MKKNRYILTAILSTGLLASCSKSFLDQNPTNQVPEEQVFTTADNVETVINGTWSYAMETFFTFAVPGYTSILRASDAMGSDVAITTKYGLRDAYTFVEMVDNTKNRVSAYWTILYKVIDNANSVITRVDGVTGDETQKARLKGQAYALRGMCYLTLASYYQFNPIVDPNAKAVPIYLTPTTPDTKGNPRSTIKQVYDQAIADLLAAEPLVQGYSRGDASKKYKIDINVVEGLLARAYLQTQQWTLAQQKAAAARNGYPLMSADDYGKGFNDVSNPEWIWGHPQTPNQSNASYNFHFLDVSSPGSYYFSFMADPFFKNFFDNGDVRTKLFDWDTLPSQEGFLRYKKFRFRDETALIGDFVLMRSGEMALIEAEAYARAGNTGAAATKLNELRSARTAYNYVAGTGNIIDTILVERRKELWGEGFSLSDIIRTNGTVVRKAFTAYDGTDSVINVPRGNGTFKQVKAKGHRTLRFPDGTVFVPQSNYYLFSIPISEVQNNPNL
ncbi:RagB/SusD family nutrient uptake outer membrane protein [Chitinophaga sp. sic0106]|uniref:RagB/SusD family nutrient uptake outer membrane protein n=1 Tax=Chitinophaga sp. sic0106 TaxID=2854785 RepID=UPI001C45FEC4|nr:RagB/SusD family nutrient uptake outer membrane protein [Chitinophaga sp. sic0106]MBV7532047.1 RagB/SusD family nutrient uptake outer membrane protein [Chitinophaga sp. sic0106]